MYHGELTRPLSASASIHWWRDEKCFAQHGRGTMVRDDGGVLLTRPIYTTDLLLHLVSPVRDVAGFAMTPSLRAIDTEDVASGAIGVIDATSASRPGFPQRTEIAGTKASAVLVGDRLEWHPSEGPPEILDTGTGGGADPMAFDHGPYHAPIAEMPDAITQNRLLDHDARGALHVQCMIEAWLADARRRA